MLDLPARLLILCLLLLTGRAETGVPILGDAELAARASALPTLVRCFHLAAHGNDGEAASQLRDVFRRAYVTEARIIVDRFMAFDALSPEEQAEGWSPGDVAPQAVARIHQYYRQARVVLGDASVGELGGAFLAGLSAAEARLIPNRSEEMQCPDTPGDSPALCDVVTPGINALRDAYETSGCRSVDVATGLRSPFRE
ncbi:MAG: hypothetical protein AAGE01_25375 [Pseudomonadota bacterium]